MVRDSTGYAGDGRYQVYCEEKLLILSMLLSISIISCSETALEPSKKDIHSIEITSPKTGDTLTALTRIMIDIDEQEGIEWVSYYIDNWLIGRRYEPPYTQLWLIWFWQDDQSYTVVAKAKYASGTEIESPPVTVIIPDGISEVPDLIAPEDNAVLSSPCWIVFQWTPVSMAVNYERMILYKCFDGHFCWDIKPVKGLSDTITVEGPGYWEGEWCVRAYGNRKNTNWSEKRKFVVDIESN